MVGIAMMTIRSLTVRHGGSQGKFPGMSDLRLRRNGLKLRSGNLSLKFIGRKKPVFFNGLNG